MKRIALIAGVSIATLLSAGPAAVHAAPFSVDSWWGGFRTVAPPEQQARPKPIRPRPRSTEKTDRKVADKPLAPPSGPLHVIVSIAKQRATLFDNGVPVASTAVSTGTPSHPTPTGLFTIIQKSRHHVSNLYHAPMPFMQRITWSGSALHQGPLPGYPASHGCVRLGTDFAELLWKTTKMGARVIITRDEVAPMTIEHVRLFVPTPPRMAVAPMALTAQAPSAPVVRAQSVPAVSVPSAPAAAMAAAPPTAASRIKTADASNAVAIVALVGDASKAVATGVETAPAANALSAEQASKLSTTDGVGGPSTANAAEPIAASPSIPGRQSVEAAKPTETPDPAPQTVGTIKMTAAPAPIIIDERPASMPPAIVKEAARRPVSVFVSLKEGKLYVRQGWRPVFETPVSFQNPNEPIGTHVYTAMGVKPDGSGLRWTVVSIPSSLKGAAEPKASERKGSERKASEQGRKPKNDRAVKAVEVVTPVPSASAALDRLIMPPDAVERISEMMMPGSSLIVSDNRLSDETGEYTDFIVLTR
jgi:lipoprotein-anchoring transpeptidase ErfK/SrfK